MNVLRYKAFALICCGLLLSLSSLSQAETLFFDEFNSNTNGWRQVESDSEYLEIKNGYYNFSHYDDTAGSEATLQIQVDQTRNFTVETAIIKKSGDAATPFYGLRWTQSDDKNYLDFAIDGFGFFSIYKVVDGFVTSIVAWSESAHLNQGTETANILSIKKNDTTLEFIINGNPVHSMATETILGEYLGFFISFSQEIAIDYLKVSQSDPVIECTTSPGAANLTSPGETITDTTPDLTWKVEACATWYKLFVWNGDEQRVHSKWYEAANICSGDTCSASPDLELSSDNYTFWVKSWNEAGSVWSDGLSFTLAEMTPDLPSSVTPLSPSGIITQTSPTFTWSADTYASWYRLLIWDSEDKKIYSKWYEAADFCTGDSCSVTLGLELPADTYQFWVKSWNEAGSVWSDGMVFTLESASSIQ